MKRKIIKIDERICNGCAKCIPNCPEGAIQIIDKKARLVSDLFCDGLGACLGTCPLGAISVQEREAEPYNEYKVMENIVKGGKNVIKAHLKHLIDHNENELFNQAVSYLKENEIANPLIEEKTNAQPAHNHMHPGGCPGSRMMFLRDDDENKNNQSENTNIKSQLRQWPVQLRLLNSNAPYFDNADLLIAADCVPFTYANFHHRFLKGKTLIVFCPKLDHDLNEYVEKMAQVFSAHAINSITIVHMEVPCCSGVETVIRKAMELAGKNITIKDYTISLKGDIV